MPEKWYKSVAKKSRKKSGKRTPAKKIKRYKKEAMENVPKHVKDKHAYATAVALRRAQKTGSKPHAKLAAGAESNLICPKCSSADVLAGTSIVQNHCGECGHSWGKGKKPKETDGGKHKHVKEDATTSGAIGDVTFGPAIRKRKRKRPTKKDIDEAIESAFAIAESYNDNYNRPNQQERRTNIRMSDGTTPAGAIDRGSAHNKCAICGVQKTPSFNPKCSDCESQI